MPKDTEDRDWQRLDKWLWCARFLRARTDCQALVGQGSIRINRQATDKAHARLRIGDVVTLPLHGDVLVVRVLGLAQRRGPATEARLLYEEVSHPAEPSCVAADSSAYRRLRIIPHGRGRDSRSHPRVAHDLRGHRKLHQMQIHGLR